MIYPGKYRVTSPFGQRVLFGKTENHKGIDVVGVGDKHVCAVVGGVVAVSTMVTDPGNRTSEWGNYVRVDGDDGKKYYYCHLSVRLVSVGRRVAAGEHIGIEGSTGLSTGAHCHFEVRLPSGVSVDPSRFLGIPNAIGEYGTDWRTRCKTRFGLSDGTLAYLDGYAYAADLYRKLGGAK